jgi:hypothetical protein
MPGVPIKHFNAIYQLRFEAVNLARLRKLHIRGDIDDGKDYLTFDNSGLSVTKAKGAIRELTSLSVWLEGFTNFTSIMIKFFAEKHGITLATDLLAFQSVILELSRDYEWSPGVRELAVAAQENARQIGYLSEGAWTIPTILQDTYLRNSLRSSTHATPSISTLSGTQPVQKKARLSESIAERKASICRKYNQGECRYEACDRRHVCSTCQGNHSSTTCTKR